MEVRGVDRLVDRQPRQSGDQIPEDRGHDAVGEVLGQRFHGRARDAGFVQRPGIAAHDPGDGAAGAGEPVMGEGPRDAGDPVVEVALRDQGEGDDGLGNPAPGRGRGEPGQRRARQGGERHQDGEQDEAARPRRGPVPVPVGRVDEGAGERHRMRQTAPQPAGIADQGIEQQGGGQRRRRRDGEQHDGSVGERPGTVNRDRRGESR